MDATFALTLIEAVLILLAIAIAIAVRLISPLYDRCKDVGDSIPTVSSPPCIIVAPPAIKYDVFPSFRGEDTRHICSCKDVSDSIPTVSSPSRIIVAPSAIKYDMFPSFRGEDTRHICSCEDVSDSIPTVSSPSHIIVAPPAIKYDVFPSFRGEDTRHNFSSYLCEALHQAGIHTFMDENIEKGDHISPILLKAIEESQISLIIFSKDYASSTWCMDELVYIMKCKDKYRRLVIPIFYNVDPSDIRKQNGRFGDGFAELKQRFKHDQKRVQEWENALIKSASLAGWDSKNIRLEAELVKEIVKDVLSKLKRMSSMHLEGLVGIDRQIQEAENLLSEARIVGFKHNQKRVQEWKNALIKSPSLAGWDSKNFRTQPELLKKIVKDVFSKMKRKTSIPMEWEIRISDQLQEVKELVSKSRIIIIQRMSGIGKTTLARALFYRLQAEFEASCFVEDVRPRL